MEPDFSGYATKAGLRCTDGRIITGEAFAHQDQSTVPLVWQHARNEPSNVLGHAELETRPDGVYAYGFFNSTKNGQHAKQMIQHGDITSLSIYANNLVEKSKTVTHGNIREVSLVLAGANPGAKIDYVAIQHSDGELEDIDEAVIFTGLSINHAEEEAPMDEETYEMEHAENTTLADVFNTLSDQQKDVVYYMIGAALEQADAEHGNFDPEGTYMAHNVFENNGGDYEPFSLSHSDVQSIVAAASRTGSLKEAVEDYALQHGIENIDILFPDAKAINNTPEFDKRRTEWVSTVLGGTSHSPFSRIKNLSADITMDEARAKGYIKGNFKKEEFFSLTKRTTGPTTIYKKQKLDRDDILDITDFDVVAWMKGEMRLMLEEELARAILIGDGRDPGDEDKIKDPMAATDGLGIRSIANEHELYATTINVNLDDANSSYNELIDAIIRARVNYKGTGTPTFFTTEAVLTSMLLLRDADGRRLYRTASDLASELRVDSIVPVEVMNGATDLVGIIVNLRDFVVGADKGGDVSMFDDFDIDYNQFKYLIETRVSGALNKLKSALVIRKTAAANVLVAPTTPAFDQSTGVVTIPTKTGVVYKNKTTNATLTSGAQSALAAGATLEVLAVPAANYYFEDNAHDEWTFTRPSA